MTKQLFVEQGKEVGNPLAYIDGLEAKVRQLEAALAAARDLLTALKAANAVLIWYRARHFDINGKRIGDMIDAAIAKAEVAQP